VRVVGVVGPSDSDPALDALAEAVGAAIALAGAQLVCGGLGGVMAAACRGAWSRGGVTVGLLPGVDRHAANRWVTVAVPTGLGEMRNALVVRAADALVAVGGSWGTLTEVALARRTGVPVVGLRPWALANGLPELTEPADDPAEAVALALRLASRHDGTRPDGHRGCTS